MNYEMRETPEQVEQKNADLQALATMTNSVPHGLYEQKYRLDAVMVRDGDVVAWVEHKTSGNDFGCLINAAKAATGVEQARTSKVPFILLARQGDRLMYCTVFDIKSKTNWTNILHDENVRLIWQVDTRPGHDNGDDSEPCYSIPWVLFNEVR